MCQYKNSKSVITRKALSGYVVRMIFNKNGKIYSPYFSGYEWRIGEVHIALPYHIAPQYYEKKEAPEEVGKGFFHVFTDIKEAEYDLRFFVKHFDEDKYKIFKAEIPVGSIIIRGKTDITYPWDEKYIRFEARTISTNTLILRDELQ